jgi:hypothetical protein
LALQKSWFIKIYLNLRWQEIDTKMILNNIDMLQKWIDNRWN